MISWTPMIIMSSYREFIEAEKSRKVERSVKKPNSEIARSASTFLIWGDRCQYFALLVCRTGKQHVHLAGRVMFSCVNACQGGNDQGPNSPKPGGKKSASAGEKCTPGHHKMYTSIAPQDAAGGRCSEGGRRWHVKADLRRNDESKLWNELEIADVRDAPCGFWI